MTCHDLPNQRKKIQFDITYYSSFTFSVRSHASKNTTDAEI